MEERPKKPHELRKDRIFEAILVNPNQDPCVTIEGEVIQTGRPHLDLALTLIDMVNYGEIQRSKEGIWQLVPPPEIISS